MYICIFFLIYLILISKKNHVIDIIDVDDTLLLIKSII